MDLDAGVDEVPIVGSGVTDIGCTPVVGKSAAEIT